MGLIQIGGHYVDPARVISVWEHNDDTMVNVDAVSYTQTFSMDRHELSAEDVTDMVNDSLALAGAVV